jgi:hypothetical protein
MADDELTFIMEVDNYLTAKQLLIYANKIRKKMIILAKQNLSSDVSKEYIRGLTPVETVSETEVTFSISGFLPCAIEGGMDGFDMKPGLLSGPKAKISKAGDRYNIIPMKDDEKSPRISKKNPYGNIIFRIVSDKSKKGSWVHPGLQPRLFFETAIKEVE